MLREVEKADLGIQLGGGKKVGGVLFADDFIGVSGSKEGLQKLISVVHGYCNKWRLRANVCKSAVMVFSRNPSVNGGNISYLGYPITLTWVLILHVMGPGTCISKIYAIIVKRKLSSCIV